MKILFLASWYPTDKNPNFGIFIKEHAHAIKKAANEIVILALVIHKDKSLYAVSVNEFADNEGIKTIIIEIKSCFSNYLNHLIYLQFLLLKKHLKKYVLPSFSPEIIHSNVIFPAGILGDKLSTFLKRPHVITEHWSRVKGFLKMPVFGRMAMKSYLRAEAILPVSEFQRANLLTLLPLLDTQKVISVPNVIDIQTFSYKTKVASDDCIRFVAVATWANKKVPDKIPELFIQALGKLQLDITKKIYLTMIGGGDKVSKLEDICFTNNIDVTFTGYLPKNEIAKHLQQADFFVHASTVETFGVVVAEALLCGTPVICSNVGALPELVEEHNGVLCENTLGSWTDGIKTCLNKKFNHQDISLQYQDVFSALNIGKKITSIYERIRK